ncbi:hypothetical protein FE257_004561 [Aspergillus nanangensis]|uniref:Uncharacterized protein n=1 Tax=Aspergillus nanangensis TaxID=2582783 RepID=A0AAD4CYC3_ASPNN|nr:hypothetical protein FE257_004561 [Aspergillus nanangensis]
MFTTTTSNTTMRGIIYAGTPSEMTVQTLPMPQITHPDEGIVEVKAVAGRLVEFVPSGRADPGFVGTATIGIEEVPEYYGRFNATEEIKERTHKRASERWAKTVAGSMAKKTNGTAENYIERAKRILVAGSSGAQPSFARAGETTTLWRETGGQNGRTRDDQDPEELKM